MADENVLREIQRETRERLDVLEIDRLDLPEKRAKEDAAVGDASRVEFSERDWRKRRPETLDEIKRAVDAMGTPREERLKVGERVFLPPAEALPPTRALTDLERKAIEAHLGAKVVRASIIYRSSRGHVVEVEHDNDGRKEMTLLSVLGERVRDLGDIRSRIDAFDPKGANEEVAAPPAAPSAAPPVESPAPEPAPVEATTSVEVQAAPATAEAAAPETKKRFSLPKMGRKKTDAPPETTSDDPAGEKKGFSLPRFGKKKDEAAAEPPPPDPEPAKKRFSMPTFGKKKDEAAPDATPDAAETPPADAEAPAGEGKGLSRFLRRKKDA